MLQWLLKAQCSAEDKSRLFLNLLNINFIKINNFRLCQKERINQGSVVQTAVEAVGEDVAAVSSVGFVVVACTAVEAEFPHTRHISQYSCNILK